MTHYVNCLADLLSIFYALNAAMRTMHAPDGDWSNVHADVLAVYQDNLSIIFRLEKLIQRSKV